MRPRFLSLGIFALAPLAAAAAVAQSGDFVYAPGTQHYRLVTQVHHSQIQGGGRAPFEFDVKTTQLVTANITAKSRDTLQLELTVDSIDVSSELNAPQPDVKRLFGAKLHGLISPQGKIYAFDPPPGTSDPQLVALYGALVFPFRYYLRRRSMSTALTKYLISTGILYLLFVGGFVGFWLQGYFPNDSPGQIALFFGAIWGVFTLIAFIICGVLSGQRALRSFRSNIKKI